VSQQPAIELLTSLADVLRRRGYRWYLFGAQAVILWGTPRMSADVDVTVEMALEDTPDFVAAMEHAGFDLRIQNVEEFVAETRVLPFLHRATEMPVDVVLAGPGLEELFFQRVREVYMAQTKIPVISPEDLVITKILAGRPKDREDVHGILRERRASLDVELIRETLVLLEQALGRSDLSPVLDAELDRSD
jgi:hypothetical protein